MPQATPLANTLGATVGRCQSLLAGVVGPKAGMYSRDYLLPFINQAYEDMDVAIRNGSSKNLEAVIEVLNVPVGTSDLSKYQGYQAAQRGDQQPVRGPLVGLFDPLRMWVKTAGQLPQFYTPAIGPRDTLPHINPPGITPGTYAVQVTFCWMGNNLSITPVAGPIDIQVYGRFNPPELVSDDDLLILYPRMTAALAYAASALTGVERTNPAILQGYELRATAMLDNIIADVIRQCQKNARRLAKIGGRGGTAWGWGGTAIW